MATSTLAQAARLLEPAEDGDRGVHVQCLLPRRIKERVVAQRLHLFIATLPLAQRHLVALERQRPGRFG